MALQERMDRYEGAERRFQMAIHGVESPSGGSKPPGQPSVGSDPTQGAGTDAWQRALQMGLQKNAQNRRN